MKHISLSLLKHRAIIKKPANYNTGLVPDYVVDASDVPCLVVPEAERQSDMSLGRMVTGRYQVLFQPGVELEPGYKALITEAVVGKHSTEWKDMGTFLMETVVKADTHVEAIAIKET